MSAARDFAEIGEDLLRLVAGLARATDGRFDGPAGTALETARTYAEAAIAGFSALAVSSTLDTMQRHTVSMVASGFRQGLGAMATHFPPGGTVTTLAPLSENDPEKPDRLAAYFSSEAPFVTVSITARNALESLRRDPLALATLNADDITSLMGAAAAGVTVREL